MPTMVTFRGKELPQSFAEQIGATSDARVEITVVSPGEEKTELRKAAVERLGFSMDAMSREAREKGLTEGRLNQILTEIEEEKDKARGKFGLPMRDSKHPIDINNW